MCVCLCVCVCVCVCVCNINIILYIHICKYILCALAANEILIISYKIHITKKRELLTLYKLVIKEHMPITSKIRKYIVKFDVNNLKILENNK